MTWVWNLSLTVITVSTCFFVFVCFIPDASITLLASNPSLSFGCHYQTKLIRSWDWRISGREGRVRNRNLRVHNLGELVCSLGYRIVLRHKVLYHRILGRLVGLWLPRSLMLLALSRLLSRSRLLDLSQLLALTRSLSLAGSRISTP